MKAHVLYGLACALIALLGGCAKKQTQPPGPLKIAGDGGETATFDATLLGEQTWARGRFGLRAAFLMPVAADTEEFNSTVAFGLFYQELSFRQNNLIFEVGLDYAGSESDSGYVSSNLFMVRGDVMFAPWARVGAHTSQYWVVGFHGIAEIAEDVVTGDTYNVYEAGPTLGWGFMHPRAGWDFRVTGAWLLGSDNAKALVNAGTAYAF